jgi:hypothetical protein
MQTEHGQVHNVAIHLSHLRIVQHHERIGRYRAAA